MLRRSLMTHILMTSPSLTVASSSAVGDIWPATLQCISFT